jgi:EpsI family protein
MPKLLAYTPAFVLALGVGFVLHTRSQVAVPLARPLSTIMQDVSGYRVENQKVSAEERRVAGMSDYVARAYFKDSVLAFTTLVSYYERQTQGQTIHSPRNCLPGAGWEILNGGTRVVTADGTPNTVNRYVLKNGAHLAVAYYWYQGRGRVVANEYTVKWNLLRDAAIAGHTEEALVRVVVFVDTPPSLTDSVAMQHAYAAADTLGEDIARKLIHDVRLALPNDGSARQPAQAAANPVARVRTIAWKPRS